jgi:hypothetical protein
VEDSLARQTSWRFLVPGKAILVLFSVDHVHPDQRCPKPGYVVHQPAVKRIAHGNDYKYMAVLARALFRKGFLGNQDQCYENQLSGTSKRYGTPLPEDETWKRDLGPGGTQRGRGKNKGAGGRARNRLKSQLQIQSVGFDRRVRSLNSG